MPEIVFTAVSSDGTSSPLSVQDFKEQFLKGIPLSKGENSITDETIQFYLDSAVEQLESLLGLKLNQQVVKERKDFIQDDWLEWGYIKATYPVLAASSLSGYYGDKLFIKYPVEWLSVRTTTDYKSMGRDFRIVPGSGAISYDASVAIYISSIGVGPYVGWWRNNRQFPNYWQIEYVTGFPNNIIPKDLIQAIGMIAAIPILGIASDLQNQAGLGYGVSSKSISLDGLSHSVSTFANGQNGVFGARMKQYGEQLFGAPGKPQGLVSTLKDAYSSIIWTVC